MYIKGCIEEWSSVANMLFAFGCEAQSFVLLASLSAPLMPLIKSRDLGAVVSIYGGKKSGKTTAIAAAETAWGPRESCANQSPPQPWISEKFINIDPGLLRIEFEKIIETKDASPIIISAAGMSLFQALDIDHPFDMGCEFEVKVPSGLIDPKAKNWMEVTLDDNCGHAGPRMVEWLADEKNKSAARRLMTSYRNGMAETVTGHPFAARTIAAVRIAGEIAVKLGIVQCDPERIAAWAMRKYQ